MENEIITCDRCKEKGLKSTVYISEGDNPIILSYIQDSYYDEEGKFNSKSTISYKKRRLVCSNNHSWDHFYPIESISSSPINSKYEISNIEYL